MMVGYKDEGDFAVVWFAWRKLTNLDDGLRFLRFLVFVCRLMREEMTMEKMRDGGGFRYCGGESELGFHMGASMIAFLVL
ncbi:hypothetical protein LR48_Vigan05g148100 [Vigna angularis]|uniref:Uncharacterized protein n=1 Tax=Phaseolus angularis TaxID=3914 RepID=A0A0L9UME1_PHAAN|nr:hypothetical protein LR48_Vigan05g148100 [Vigna angularis]